MSNVDRTRTHAAVSAVAAAEQQPEGWRFVPDAILPGYQWAPQWVPARTPTVHWGPISKKAVGGPRTQFNTRVQCRNTANMVAEQCRSRAGALAARALLTRVYCVMTGHRNEEPIEFMHEDFQVDSYWVGDMLERKNTTGVIVRRGIEERVLTTSENKTTYETNYETNDCSSIQRRWWLPHVHTWITWDVRRWCFTPQRRLLRLMDHERWDNVFSATNLEMLYESGTSSQLVDTSVRLVGDDFCVAARQKQIQTVCELTVWKSLVVNVMTDW